MKPIEYLLELTGLTGVLALLAYLPWSKVALGSALTLIGAFFPKTSSDKSTGDGSIKSKTLQAAFKGSLRVGVILAGIGVIIVSALDVAPKIIERTEAEHPTLPTLLVLSTSTDLAYLNNLRKARGDAQYTPEEIMSFTQKMICLHRPLGDVACSKDIISGITQAELALNSLNDSRAAHLRTRLSMSELAKKLGFPEYLISASFINKLIVDEATRAPLGTSNPSDLFSPPTPDQSSIQDLIEPSSSASTPNSTKPSHKKKKLANSWHSPL